jgi:hypothetical protein
MVYWEIYWKKTIAPVVNCASKYSLTKKVNVGLAFTIFFDYYYKNLASYGYTIKQEFIVQHIDNFYGLQLCVDHNMKQWTRKKHHR